MSQKDTDCVIVNSAVIADMTIVDIDILCCCRDNEITVDKNSISADFVEQTACDIAILSALIKLDCCI